MDALTTYISDAGYGVRSAASSTTTPLAGGATFTAVGERNLHPDVFIDVRTDADCTVYMEFSVDGTNWTRFPVNGYSLSSTNNWTVVDKAVKSDRHFRLVIVNGASDQTFLRAAVTYGTFGLLNAPLNQSYNLQSGSILTRQSWTWLDVSRGLAGGIDTVEKFGRATVGTTFLPICFGGVYQTPQSGSGTTLRVAAGNAADNPAGAGARSVFIEGIEDVTWARVSETLATNGAAAGAAGSVVFSRIFRAFVAGSGTYATAVAQSHVGNIVIENSGGGTKWAEIDATTIPKGQSEIGAFTFAEGETGFVKLRHITVDTGKTIDIIFFQRLNADQTSPPYSSMRAQSVLTGVTGGEIQPFGESEVPLGPFVGPCDVGFMGKVSTGSATISVEFEIFRVRE